MHETGLLLKLHSRATSILLTPERIKSVRRKKIIGIKNKITAYVFTNTDRWNNLHMKVIKNHYNHTALDLVLHMCHTLSKNRMVGHEKL